MATVTTTGPSATRSAAGLAFLGRPAGFLRSFAPQLAILLLFSWGMVLVAWFLIPVPRTVELDIPLGTAERVARGETVETLPSTLLLRRGDTLLLTNSDTQAHRIGLTWAAPGQATRTVVTDDFQQSGTLLCSFHPGGSINVSPQARPEITRTAGPTLLLWLPLSAAMMLTLSITRRLHTT